jgi:hypothetical protein
MVSPVLIMNKPGGGGAIAYTYFLQHAPDPHYLMVLAPTMFTSRIAGKGTFDINDVTPIALLFNEYISAAGRRFWRSGGLIDVSGATPHRRGGGRRHIHMGWRCR